ncbi:MAG: ABC transporter permease [Gammaproteobacteria bacterium]|nr:ABC transporter permease [Gammaproteobacteria bacterium]
MDQSHSYDLSVKGKGEYLDAWRDIVAGAKMWRVWLLLGWRDFRNQTNRTLLGPLWSVIGVAITVAAIGYVYGALLAMSPEHGYPYIAGGFVCWFFISGCLQGGLTVFIANAGVLRERALPISFSVYRYTWRMFIEFGLKFLVFAGAAMIVDLNPGWIALYAIPGAILYFLTGLWVNLFFGLVGTRARDVTQLVTPLMLIAFLSTPILWPKEALGKRQFISDLNPFTHFIDVIREPLLGSAPPLIAVLVVGAFLVLGSSLTFLLFAKLKARLVFWL